MTIKNYLTLILCLVSFCGCRTVPTELVDARKALAHASNGDAPQLAPTELRKAREALARAEESYRKENSYKTRDLAYVAQRNAQLAEVKASTQAAARDAEKAMKDYQAAQSEIIKQSKEKLAEEQQKVLQEQQKASQLELELSKLAAVSQEKRGLVITLSGSVLFTSGQSVLLPSAQDRLDQVTKALMENPKQKLIVEGHTDSQGSDTYNLDLSQRRAEAVKSYLVSRGYPEALIDARGIGKARPVADNNTAEGRANNRRVEIVVVPEASN